GLEADVQDRLGPTNGAAVPQRRHIRVVEARVPAADVSRRESEREAVDGVLVGWNDDAFEEVGARSKAEDAGGDRVPRRQLMREREPIVVIRRDAIADRMPLRHDEVAALVDLMERGVE